MATISDVLLFTNVRIFRSIADSAYKKMSEDLCAGIRPKPDGGPGVVKTFDPKQMAFKEAMISIVFSCIWLEAILHLLIVQKYERKCYKKVDRKTYEYKLRLLKCEDVELLRNVKRLRTARKEIVHEKAHFEFDDLGKFEGNFMLAQDEAENANEVMIGVTKWCKSVLQIDVS